MGEGVDGFSVGDRVFVGEPHKEYAAVAADSALKLPEGLPAKQAAFLNVLGVGQLALRKGRPGLGENVAIVGLGVVGLSALAFCQAFRFPALAIDTDERRLARRHGRKRHRAAADVVIEAATAWPAIMTAMDVVRPQGKVVVVATHTDMPEFSPVSYPYNVGDESNAQIV